MTEGKVAEEQTEGVLDPGDAMDREPLVRLHDLAKVYDGSSDPAVQEIDLEIFPGEFFSLLGPSGCGKTTTLRLIAGFERPTRGKVYLGGEDVSFRPANKRDVNTVFQNYALFPHMTVAENVAYPLKMRHLDRVIIRQRVAGIIERVEMTGFEDRKPHQLSGGQRQRVALARSLIAEPKVLLLDEPLGALDLKLRETMLVALKSLQRDIGITFLYVTHDQSEALGMSDRIAVMNRGRIEQIATPSDLYWRPESAFVAQFIGKTNILICRTDGDGQLRAGSLPVVTSTELKGALTLSIRPEEIEIGPDSARYPNHFIARIEEILFIGHEQEIVIQLGGQTLVVRVPGRTDVRRGDEIEVGWAAENAVIVQHSAENLDEPSTQ
jgi:spermidine/putrescine transport system ATP-binding protein